MDDGSNDIHKLTNLTPSKPVDLPCGTVEHLNSRWPDASTKYNSCSTEGNQETDKCCSLHVTVSNTYTSLSLCDTG